MKAILLSCISERARLLEKLTGVVAQADLTRLLNGQANVAAQPESVELPVKPAGIEA